MPPPAAPAGAYKPIGRTLTLVHPEMEHKSNSPSKRAHQEFESSDVLPRLKRPKSSKACNACRKQKSRCERLAGEKDSCHRCSVIGISCVFDVDPIPESAKARKPRPLLPRTTRPDVAQSEYPQDLPTPQTRYVALQSLPDGHGAQSSNSPDTARLHVLADTTEMLSRPAPDRPDHFASHHPPPSLHPRESYSSAMSPVPSIMPTSKTPLSLETLSTVESTLFPSLRDPTSEGQSARIRADWRRWVAPLSLLQSLVRRNRPNIRPMSPRSQQLVRSTDNATITPAQECCLKEHFRQWYLPWLPAVRFAQKNAPNCLDDISPFLTTVLCATAARTVPEISPASIEHLRSLALHHVGTVFSNPAAHRLVDSMYALLVLVLWPLDPADDAVLLINGAKQLANAYERLRGSSLNHSDELDLDHTRLWYTICASETILNLGAGLPASPPSLENLLGRLGTASDLALQSGCTSDILLVLQTSLHTIVATAMGEEHQVALKGGPPLLKGREPLLHYISTVHMILTRLGEWDIEFHAISAEFEGPEAVHYAALEIEYHYLRLMLVTHCLLTLCHACPLTSAPDEVKFALWSWSITGNKSAHAAVRLFNVFSSRNHDTPPPLASAPDRIFAMMAVSVMLILRHQVAAYEYGRRRGVADTPPAGFTKQAENAIRRAAGRMAALGRGGSADHAAARYVEILEALLRIWEEKRAQRGSYIGGTPCQLPRLAVSEPLHDNAFGEGVESMQIDMDLNLLGGDVFSDSAFPWDGIGSSDMGSFGQ